MDPISIMRVSYETVTTTLAIGRYVQPKLLKYIHQPTTAPRSFGQSQSQSQDSYLSTEIVDWYVKN